MNGHCSQMAKSSKTRLVSIYRQSSKRHIQRAYSCSLSPINEGENIKKQHEEELYFEWSLHPNSLRGQKGESKEPTLIYEENRAS